MTEKALSAGLHRSARVLSCRIDVSEEHVGSFFRATGKPSKESVRGRVVADGVASPYRG
jgi:hypothetical protein